MPLRNRHWLSIFVDTIYALKPYFFLQQIKKNFFYISTLQQYVLFFLKLVVEKTICLHLVGTRWTVKPNATIWTNHIAVLTPLTNENIGRSDAYLLRVRLRRTQSHLFVSVREELAASISSMPTVLRGKVDTRTAPHRLLLFLCLYRIRRSQTVFQYREL